MPPKESQKQKQKQTVIVNIGDKVVKKKRKRKPRKKAAPRTPPPPPPSPFVPHDFARVIFQPQPPLRPDDNLAVQLNAVTKQLNELQEKQKNRTGNLMAGQKAMEREAQQFGDPEPDPEPQPEPAPAKKRAARRTKQQIEDDQDAAAAAALALGEVPQPKRPYVKRQTKAEEAAAILLQQSGVMGGGRQPSLADFDGGSAMSSLTMTPGLLQTPAAEPANPKNKLRIVDELSPTPATSSISGTSYVDASAETSPRF